MAKAAAGLAGRARVKQNSPYPDVWPSRGNGRFEQARSGDAQAQPSSCPGGHAVGL